MSRGLRPLATGPASNPGAAVPGSNATAPGLLEARVDYDLHAPIRLAGPAPDLLTDHHRRYGPRPGAAGHAGTVLLDTLDRIGLSGRGGGHFAVARKWQAVLGAGGGGTVVANGAEGEPASAKDAALLQHRPHLVLDGLACAVEAVGADRAVVWLHAGAVGSHRAIARALSERRAAGLREPTVEIVAAPDSYLSGESSAIVRALSGGPALPTFRRVPAAVRGAGGRPTLVHNVETLARIGLAARSAADGYRDSTLVTVLAGGRRTVLEVPPTATVAAAAQHAEVDACGAAPHTEVDPCGAAPHTEVDPCGAAPRTDVQAVLLGGYGGAWLRWEQAARLPLEHRGLQAAGAGLGAGIVVPFPTDRCGLRETARVVAYLSRSSAGQCGPCLFGLPDVAGLMRALATGEAGRASLRRLLRFAGEIDGRGACHHPDGAVRLVRTALATFAEDADHHVRRGRCRHRPGAPLLPVPAGELV